VGRAPNHTPGRRPQRLLPNSLLGGPPGQGL
jgi:hypothetical protein